jgi:hypothetical protein
MQAIAQELRNAGHSCQVPILVEGVNYWDENSTHRVQAKKDLDLIREHMRKIETADAILVVNVLKDSIENYIGANTFGEMQYAFYLQKPIFLLNPIPNQPYIADELASMDIVVLNNDLTRISETPKAPHAEPRHPQPLVTGSRHWKRR